MDLFNQIPDIVFHRVKKRIFSRMALNIHNHVMWDLDLIFERHFGVFHSLKFGQQSNPAHGMP